MKFLFFAALLFVSLPRSLSVFRDKNRILLVFAPSAGDSRFRKQSELLRGKDDGLKERDLLRFDVFEASDSPLRKQYDIKPGEFRVLLIGKDGHTAYSAAHPVAAPNLFHRIDQMPMRRDEMRRRER